MDLKLCNQLTEHEREVVLFKATLENQVIFAAMLIHYKKKLEFPGKNSELINEILQTCQESGIFWDKIACNSDGRSIRRFKKEIRLLLGYREFSAIDIRSSSNYLVKEVLPRTTNAERTKELLLNYCHTLKVENPSPAQQQKCLDLASMQFERWLFDTTFDSLTTTNKEFIDSIIDEAIQSEDKEDSRGVNLNVLKKGVPGVKLKNISSACEKYNAVRDILLPTAITENCSRRILYKFYERVMSYSPSHLKDLSAKTRYAMVAIFCHIRKELLLDNLADLFIQLLRKAARRSENYVNNSLVKEIKKVEGKLEILLKLTNVSLSEPKGVIQDAIYPIVSQETLQALREELIKRGSWYQNQVRRKMRSLFAMGSRSDLLDLLFTFDLKSNSEDKIIIEAVDCIKKYRDEKIFSVPKEVPLKGIISDSWYSFIVSDNKDSSTPEINKLSYELCICSEVVKRLIYKGVWIEGSHRYRDPQKDVPSHIRSAENHSRYCQELNLPLEASEFIAALKADLEYCLKGLNASILDNKKVTIKKNGRIKISRSLPQEPSTNIGLLHQEILRRWGNINLIDAFKEADLRINFTEHFVTAGKYSCINQEELRMRLLLALYGIGSNTGLKRISIANPDVTEDDLKYVKKRFINATNLRRAIVSVVNGVLQVRDPKIWGQATTSVACDSKKLSAWDQNLITQWNPKYKGRGVMVYWHIDGKALCVYSQIKTCTSSEVGSMIKGVLEHSTEMDLDAAYVDTHGQSTIGFGVGRVLGFEILPRLKNIHKQKLYAAKNTDGEKYGNIAAIIKGGIQWEYIEKNYKELIQNIIALKHGYVESDVFIKRFSNDNYKHPIYKALCEIGKVQKTIFLCKYLMDEELRIEIHEALNVVERLNGVMNFFFYGKIGEISNNDPEEQELSILGLHLLQVCDVYINTILIQAILSSAAWQKKFTAQDYRALSPLICSHFNPYGLFVINFKERLIISKKFRKS